MADALVPEYRYFVADFLTNAVIAEIPFKDVKYERAIKSAGTFSGNIPVIDSTAAYDLYDSTMPGKTTLYVVRDDVCVWGGIIWSRSYSVTDRQLSVSGSEFTSYFYHRNIWKTYTHDFQATVVMSFGLATVTLDNDTFDFAYNMPVRLSFNEVGDFAYTGNYVINAVLSPNSFRTTIYGIPDGTYELTTVYVRVDTYDYARRLINTVLSDFTDISFPNDEIEPGSQTDYRITNKSRSGGVATLTTSEIHSAIPGSYVDIENVDSTFNGSYLVTAATDFTFSYENAGSNVGSTATPVITSGVSYRSITSQVATLITDAPHSFSAGQSVVVTNVDLPTQTEFIFNGTHTISEVPAAASFTYATPGAVDFLIDLTAIAGTATVTPTLWVSTFGPFPGNSDFGLGFSTEDYSGYRIDTFDKNRRGFELRSVGEELDQYSDSLSGFEYRIDCDYDPVTSSFTRTFVMLPINFPNPPLPGQASPITRFGAQNLVFEYPGNIMDATLDESAEDAATRFFVVGNDGDLGEDASQPYSVASAIDLLAQGWPLLDQEETMTSETAANITNSNDPANVYDEDVLYTYAQRYLSEFQPPVADMKVSINGSLSPIVGTYYPGDWCCLIINDDFIRLRLASSLEPRSDILVRKIESYSVSVPNNPSFPEQVELNLITEWEVDKIG